MSRQTTQFEDALQLRQEDLTLQAGVESGCQGAPESVDCEPSVFVAQPNGSAWTIPLICLGIGIIAMAMIIPAADENRRLTWEREKLAADLLQIEKQISRNDDFLARLANDPGLSERLAQRQMNMVREGTSVLELPGRSTAGEMSPYQLVTLPPPPAMPEYSPIGGRISRLFHHPKSRLYLLGAGMLLIVLGVILGSQKPPRAVDVGEA